MTTRRLSDELLIALMEELFTAVGPVGLTKVDAIMLTELSHSQFERGLRLARRAGIDIAYDVKGDKHYRLAADYAVGRGWTVGRLRDAAARMTTIEGFLAGLAFRHPDRDANIRLVKASVAAAKEQATALADVFEREDRHLTPVA